MQGGCPLTWITWPVFAAATVGRRARPGCLTACLREIVDLPAWASRLRSSRSASCRVSEVLHWFEIRATNFVRTLKSRLRRMDYSATRLAFAVRSTRRMSKPQNSWLDRSSSVLAFATYCIMRWRFLHHSRRFVNIYADLSRASYTCWFRFVYMWHDDSFLINLCRLRHRLVNWKSREMRVDSLESWNAWKLNTSSLGFISIYTHHLFCIDLKRKMLRSSTRVCSMRYDLFSR